MDGIQLCGQKNSFTVRIQATKYGQTLRCEQEKGERHKCDGSQKKYAGLKLRKLEIRKSKVLKKSLPQVEDLNW